MNQAPTAAMQRAALGPILTHDDRLLGLSWITNRIRRTGARIRTPFGTTRKPAVRCILAAALCLLAGCGNTRFSLPGTTDDPALYAGIFPYYIEVCALSAMKKKPGFGFEYRGGPGGHAVVDLNGVR